MVFSTLGAVTPKFASFAATRIGGDAYWAPWQGNGFIPSENPPTCKGGKFEITYFPSLAIQGFPALPKNARAPPLRKPYRPHSPARTSELQEDIGFTGSAGGPEYDAARARRHETIAPGGAAAAQPTQAALTSFYAQ